MAIGNGSAEIVNMQDARARRRASELDGNEFETAGAHLRAVREAAGLSIEELSTRTHIKAGYLAAIEEMRAGALPSQPFAIGFVKVYAEALGLDPRPVVNRFKEELGLSAPVAIEAEKFEAMQAAPEPDRPQMSLLAFIAILFFILWCAYQITRPRLEETPYRLGGGAGAQSEAAPAPSSPDALRGAPPAPSPAETALRFIDQVEAVYPKRCEASAKPVETVEIAFNVTIEGTITGERVASSSNPCFEDAALNAARRWRFEPPTVDGAPRAAYDQRHRLTFVRPN